MGFTKTVFYTLLIASSFGINSTAEAFTEPDPQIAPFEKACNGTNIPSKVALAIAKHESGLNAYAVNVAGTGYMPDSREEALEIIEAAEAAGASYDVGLMQINNQWFNRLGVSPASLLEPEKNIEIGVKILAGEFKKHGKNWTAVGYYHSPNSSRGLAYSKNIYQLYHRVTQPKNTATLKNPKATKVQSYAEQKTSNQNLLNDRGIWRNSSASRESRVVTFQVRKPGVIRLSSAKSGKSASQAGTFED